MGAVLRLWKLKGRLKLNSPLEEDLIGPADYGSLGHKEARVAGELGAHGTIEAGN